MLCTQLTAEFYQLLARLFQSYLLSSHFRLSLGIWDICYFKHHISVLLKKFAHPESFSHFDSDTTSDFYFIILYLFYFIFIFTLEITELQAKRYHDSEIFVSSVF